MPTAPDVPVDATPPDGPPRTSWHLDFNAPLSQQRASALVEVLADQRPTTVLDIGCGWAELLLRLLERVPTASGTGLDRSTADLERAKVAAQRRGLTDRVALVEGDVTELAEPHDLVISIGAYQAFGTVPQALSALRDLVRPSGRVLFGAEFWERPPTPADLAALWPGTTADECTDIADLVDLAHAAGFRTQRLETATRNEWELFESGHLADREIWLAENPHHPQAGEVRTEVDTQRRIWLRGHRDLLGFAYLVLVPAGDG